MTSRVSPCALAGACWAAAGSLAAVRGHVAVQRAARRRPRAHQALGRPPGPQVQPCWARQTLASLACAPTRTPGRLHAASAVTQRTAPSLSCLTARAGGQVWRRAFLPVRRRLPGPGGHAVPPRQVRERERLAVGARLGRRVARDGARGLGPARARHAVQVRAWAACFVRTRPACPRGRRCRQVPRSACLALPLLHGTRGVWPAAFQRNGHVCVCARAQAAARGRRPADAAPAGASLPAARPVGARAAAAAQHIRAHRPGQPHRPWSSRPRSQPHSQPP